MKHFKIGDICVAINDPAITPDSLMPYNGEECTVIAVLLNHYILGNPNLIDRCYRVRFRDRELVAMAHELKLKGDYDNEQWAKEQVRKLIDFPLPVEMLA